MLGNSIMLKFEGYESRIWDVWHFFGFKSLLPYYSRFILLISSDVWKNRFSPNSPNYFFGDLLPQSFICKSDLNGLLDSIIPVYAKILQNLLNFTATRLPDGRIRVFLCLCHSCSVLHLISKCFSEAHCFPIGDLCFYQESSVKRENSSSFDLFACPICYEPLIRKGPSGFNL